MDYQVNPVCPRDTLNIQHSKTRGFLYWNQPHNPAALTPAAVSVSAVTMTGTGPTLVPEQATPRAKTTTKKRLDKQPEVCRRPAPLDNSPCKYQEPFPLRILWSNPEIRGNRTCPRQKHVLKNIWELFERTAKTLEILGLYKEGLCLLPGRIYVSAMNDIGEAPLRSSESCQFLAQMVSDKMSKTLNVSSAPQLTSESFRVWSKAQFIN